MLLARDDEGIVKGVDENHALLAAKILGRGAGIVIGIAFEDDVDAAIAEAAHLVYLLFRRCHRHEDRAAAARARQE